LKNREQALDKDKAQNETILTSLQEKIKELEERIALLLKENEQYKTEISTKNKEIEYLRENDNYIVSIFIRILAKVFKARRS